MEKNIQSFLKTDEKTEETNKLNIFESQLKNHLL